MLAGLKQVLLERDLTQRALARAVGISQFRLCRIAREHVRPRGAERRVIAEFLGTSERQLFPYLNSRHRQKPQCRRQRVKDRRG